MTTRDNLCEYNADDTVCRCMSIKRYEIEPLLIGNRANDIDSVMNQCGGGTVCNSCGILFNEMMGEQVWTPAVLTQTTQLAPNVKSFRFETNTTLQPAQAGQHIAVQGYINGRWEHRRYTLTTAAEEQRYREITVKELEGGVFSTWLHNLSEGDDACIRVSEPLGNNYPNMINQHPLICFVGGIGITPALSFIRSINEESNRPFRPLLIDHSIDFDEQKIEPEDLLKLTLNNNIEINNRVTKDKNMENSDAILNQKTIIEYVKSYPNSDYFLCGPPGYIKTISSYLEVARISHKNIFIDYFTPTKAQKFPQPKRYFYIGIFLFIAFFLQDALQLKMGWLESLQSQEYYKVYSGIMFVVYLLSLFILPYTKLSNEKRLNAKTYQKHRQRGMLAPAVFYIHSTDFGSTYLLALTFSFFATLFTGLFNHESCDAIKRVSYFKMWLPIHISCAIITMSLIAFHIYIVTSY